MFYLNNFKKGFIPQNFLKKNLGGFTLIEIMIAVAIFSLLISSATTLFVSSIKEQRRSLSYQQLADQVSYAIEYMSRSCRMASKEIFDNPFHCLSSTGINFENPSGDASRLRFIKFDEESSADICHEFYLNNGQLIEYKRNMTTGEEISQPLTSDNLQINSLTFLLTGETQNDDIQPFLTIFWNIQSISEKEEDRTSLIFQTSISQRNLDIRR